MSLGVNPLTAISDTVAQTGQEEGRAAMSAASKLFSRSSEYSGKADWLRASAVQCAVQRKRAMWRRQGRRMSLCTHQDIQRRRIRSASYTQPEVTPPSGKLMLTNQKWKEILHFPCCSCQNKFLQHRHAEHKDPLLFFCATHLEPVGAAEIKNSSLKGG